VLLLRHVLVYDFLHDYPCAPSALPSHARRAASAILYAAAPSHAAGTANPDHSFRPEIYLRIVQISSRGAGDLPCCILQIRRVHSELSGDCRVGGEQVETGGTHQTARSFVGARSLVPVCRQRDDMMAHYERDAITFYCSIRCYNPPELSDLTIALFSILLASRLWSSSSHANCRYRSVEACHRS